MGEVCSLLIFISASFQSGWERLSYKNKIEDISITNNILSNNNMHYMLPELFVQVAKITQYLDWTISDNNIPDEY